MNMLGEKAIKINDGKVKMKEQWTSEQANAWYEKLGWLRGGNFIGSDCANRLDMFQKYKSEEKLATAEQELALCQKIGFNTVRIWANFDVYYAEPDSYMEIFERCGKSLATIK